MTESVLDAIPEDRRETVRSAIASTFGRAQPNAIEQITRGASGALIYRLDVGNRAYLLRLEPRRGNFDPNDAGYACMRTAAEAGIAPALHYADAASGVAIMDFVASQSLFDHPCGREGLLRGLGMLIAELQATSPFPAAADYPVLIADLLRGLAESGRFTQGLLDPHREGLRRLTEAYSWDSSATVSSHNDLNPNNILFDGERLWLVDWELAFRNDPLIDVANLTNYLAPTPELGDVLLKSWHGREPEPPLRAKLLLARQFVRLGYACLTLTVSAGAAGEEPDGELRAPSLAEFHSAIAQGRMRMSARESISPVWKGVPQRVPEQSVLAGIRGSVGNITSGIGSSGEHSADLDAKVKALRS
ncbi:MAG TPA: phosphotransferase [Gammaproteobacteria bacterium]|nr:phosphotransferase [Gammaproteobacteria bacterium]